MGKSNDFDFNFDDDSLFGENNQSNSDDGFNFGSGASGDDFGFGDTNSQAPDSDFGDFGDGQANVNEGNANKQAIIKQAAIIVVIGLIVIGLGFGITKWLTGGKKDKPSDEVQTGQTQQVQPQNNGTSNTSNNSNGWINFTSADGLSFNDEYMKSEFTVTAINHYVKVVDSENNLEIKTVLTGSLSGFIGTYELEVPYYKGSRLSTGNHFNVKVQVGKSNGKMVVGDIQY